MNTFKEVLLKDLNKDYLMHYKAWEIAVAEGRYVQANELRDELVSIMNKINELNK